MTHLRYPRGRVLAGTLATLLLTTLTANAQQSAPLPPGSPLIGRPDTDAAKKLAPVAPPPLMTPADKLPTAKLKAPTGFKIELYASGVDNARTLRGIEQVGGWFLRADKGLKMVPGDVRDLGNTYQADLIVVRPGAPSQHLDASFRVEAGKITSINLTPFSR